MSFLKMALIPDMDLNSPVEMEDDGLTAQRIRDFSVDLSSPLRFSPMAFNLCFSPDKSIVT